jgi:hypothetical protein
VRTATAPAIDTIAIAPTQRRDVFAPRRTPRIKSRLNALREAGQRRYRNDFPQLTRDGVVVAEDLFTRFAGGQMSRDILHFMRLEFAVFEGSQ